VRPWFRRRILSSLRLRTQLCRGLPTQWRRYCGWFRCVWLGSIAWSSTAWATYRALRWRKADLLNVAGWFYMSHELANLGSSIADHSNGCCLVHST
jgi:hypothetical protein